VAHRPTNASSRELLVENIRPICACRRATNGRSTSSKPVAGVDFTLSGAVTNARRSATALAPRPASGRRDSTCLQRFADSWNTSISPRTRVALTIGGDARDLRSFMPTSR